MLHFFFKQGQIILSREILASSYSGLIHFFFLAFIHLSSRPPPWPFPRIEFLSLFAADVLLICLWFFTPPPTHVLLTYLWFGSEIDVGWNDTHFTAPENKAKNRTSEKRGGYMKMKALWPCKSAPSQIQVVLSAPARLWIIPPLQKNLPRAFSILRTGQIIAISGVSVPPSYICGIPLIKR